MALPLAGIGMALGAIQALTNIISAINGKAQKAHAEGRDLTQAEQDEIDRLFQSAKDNYMNTPNPNA